MMNWLIRSGERKELYSPIGLRLLDSMTGFMPLGWVRPILDIRDGSGWRQTNIKAIFTASGIIAYPGLGRCADPLGQPASRFRIRLDAEFYRPRYTLTAAGIEFNAPPYNDINPPTPITSSVQEELLTPAVGYPFPTHVPVLRGIVVDTVGDKVESALVAEGTRDQVVTDARGGFALPLRRVVRGTPIAIIASNPRTGQTGSISVVVPDDLNTSQTITIF